MSRISVVTGSASGIGAATCEVLAARGERVIGVDLHDADLELDLGTAEGRTGLLEGVRALTDRVDTVYAVAGSAAPVAATVSVNYFGTVATLELLRPQLQRSTTPRAVLVSSMAALLPSDEQLVALLRRSDEPGALERAAVLAKDPDTGALIYASTKLALSQWVRRQAATQQWAGCGIALNAVAPGIIATPMTAEMIATDERRAALLQLVPMPLNGIAEPIVVARLLAWLGSEENSHLCGQVVYVDGGSDAVLRADGVW